MTTANDVMAYIRERMPAASDMARHKFAYYAQAWFATWEGHALFDDRIEAWTHGPVVRSAWVTDTYGPVPVAAPLGPHETQVVVAVLDFYGGLTAIQLRALTHNEAPWIMARGDIPDSERSDERISVARMRSFYTRKVMAGEPVPTRPPAVSDEAPLSRTLGVADRAIVRWNDALERLGQ